MNVTSKTGLLASRTKKVGKTIKKKTIQLRAISMPAPIILRPYAGLYNPFPYGCSLLCNHPTDKEAKDVLKRARETWATENKNIILPDEIQAIRQSLACIEDSKPTPQIESVPEELFRRYTETDSRPLTPAPTLASVKTRGSSSRRCVTPDPVITSVLRERTLLILDLRRSHSQDVLSWHGSNDPPVINIMQAPTPSISIDSPRETPDLQSRKNTAKTRSSSSPKCSPKRIQKLEVPKMQEHKDLENNLSDYEISDGEEDIIRRKGKRRKKRGRDSSRGPLAVQASIDPETQISALGSNSSNRSGRPSLVPAGSLQDAENRPHLQISQDKSISRTYNITTTKSIIDPDTLKLLQRELTAELVDMQFDKIKRAALQEVLNTMPSERKPPCEELKLLQKELNLPPINAELWLSLPRVFSRSSARFELPLHSRTLNTLTPLEYLKQHCTVSNGRRLLYNLVFNRHRDYSQEENGNRILCNDHIATALGEMMGKLITEKQMEKFRELLNWKDDVIIDFKTWCGICALFERIFAVEFCAKLPNKDMDPCNDIEIADFQSLARRLKNVRPHECLVKILNAIQEL